MKFCPRCGGLMVPVKREGKTYLKCQRCGYEEELKSNDAKSYIDKKKVEKKGAVIVESYEEKGPSEEEKELKEDYVKQLLDNLYEEEKEQED
ncbi:MAG: DNA-directed RNA polymerase subunit M [Vulcanisaeta sp.]|nr:DNA-directed RNA polymerase subunit M [Vulcanisaeta sp.]MCG2870264.1 DNA-directed RNA polymerase subunit M [Vulcanisaeta sp.]MCG2880396.1 DNA-directed RNA polymerase subunit M [Vulcanisaeta sp.]MCG2886949.1 DNA-directed RNA polymerase subunit M [Vulcanisaeta sp.]MCG2892635.1 DNA-directed RNA polymerase subunit M [Vulcanisaeta sp.]